MISSADLFRALLARSSETVSNCPIQIVTRGSAAFERGSLGGESSAG